MRLPGQTAFVLLPDRRTEFNLKGLERASVEFVADTQGVVTKLRCKQPNGVFVARRVSR